MIQFKFLKPLTDYKLAENGGLQLLVNQAHEIERWVMRFTSDSRTFVCYLWGDSILKLLDAANVKINWNDPDIQKIEDVAGIILELGTDEPPFIFNDTEHLGQMWIELHHLHNAPFKENEKVILLEFGFDVDDLDEA